MDLGLKGKVAIVTGGGRGIGKGCSTVLAQEGCSLAIADLAHDGDTRAYMDGLVKQYGVDVLDSRAPQPDRYRRPFGENPYLQFPTGPCDGSPDQSDPL